MFCPQGVGDVGSSRWQSNSQLSVQPPTSSLSSPHHHVLRRSLPPEATGSPQPQATNSRRKERRRSQVRRLRRGRPQPKRPGVVEFLQHRLEGAKLGSDVDVEEAGRLVQARWKKLVGGTERGVALVGQVAGELLGAGVLAAGAAGAEIAKVLYIYLRVYTVPNCQLTNPPAE